MVKFLIEINQFETFTELHYSQTSGHGLHLYYMFETFTELHYSQTPKSKIEVQRSKVCPVTTKCNPVSTVKSNKSHYLKYTH